MIDIHTHLCFSEFDRDREEIIAKCKKELSAVIVSSARYEEGLDVLKTTEKHPKFLFATLGYHPTEGTEPDKVLELIKNNRKRVIGIGEAGLDFHGEQNLEKREEQKNIFLKFINLAEKLKKPLVIHSWGAERECFELVRNRDLLCVFHCFSGKKEIAEEVIKNGFYISISTQILFSKNIRKIAKVTSLEQLLLETDSPFLPPDRNKDPRNYPWNIKLSAEKIAEVKKTTAGKILEEAEENAIRAFNIKF